MLTVAVLSVSRRRRGGSGGAVLLNGGGGEGGGFILNVLQYEVGGKMKSKGQKDIRAAAGVIKESAGVKVLLYGYVFVLR